MVPSANTNSGSNRIFSSLGVKIMSGLLGILGLLVGGIYLDLKGDMKMLVEDGKKDRQTMTQLNMKIERVLIIDSLVVDQMKKLEISLDELEDRIP